MTLDPTIIAALASNPDALAAYVTAASVEAPAAPAPVAAPAAPSEAPAASERDWSGYSPSKEKRETLATGSLLYALNHAGLLSLRKRPGAPMLHGACFDTRNDPANAPLNWPAQRKGARTGRKA